MATNPPPRPPFPPSPLSGTPPIPPVPRPSAPLHLLVTAGPTREKIDEVRDWGNIFTGQTGLDLALAFLDLGSVTLLTSNEQHAREFDGYSGKAGMLGIENFRTHADLKALLAERMTGGDRVDVVAMTAAVSDYQPAGVYRMVERRPAAGDGGGETWVVENVSAGKVKSSYDQIAVAGTRTEKLIDLFRTAWNFRGLLIKFKLEVGLSDEALIQVGRQSLLASRADLIVANTLAMARPAASVPASAYIISDTDARQVARTELPGALANWIRSCLSR